jgi:hypothetical protein
LERMEKEDTRGIWSKSMMPYPWMSGLEFILNQCNQLPN